MKHRKYWGIRIRRLGDAVSATIALIALASADIMNGHLIIERIPLMFVGLALALAVWITSSFISNEMEEDDDDN